MRFYFHTVILLFFLTPLLSHAKVFINEIAWMGTFNSANDEWIELYNDADNSVSLDGWILKDDASLSIQLAGAVGPGEFVVLERTDDTTTPVDALLIYKGALSNKGRTLTLFRNDGIVEDEVVGGDGWSNIGGSNNTKETAGRIGEEWITTPPTPGAPNEDTRKEEVAEQALVKESEELENSNQASVITVGESSGGVGSVAYIFLLATIFLGISAIYARKIEGR